MQHSTYLDGRLVDKDYVYDKDKGRQTRSQRKIVTTRPCKIVVIILNAAFLQHPPEPEGSATGLQSSTSAMLLAVATLSAAWVGLGSEQRRKKALQR
jgi:hypothetical protein